MAKTLTPNKNPLKEAIRSDKTRTTVTKAYNQFKPRPYVERYKPAYNVARGALFFFHFLSITFAFLFVFSFALNMVSGLSIEEISYTTKDLVLAGVAAVIASILLVFLEIGKDAVGKLFIDPYLKFGRFIYVALFFLVAIISFSVLSSTQGGLVVADYQNRVKPEEISDLNQIGANWSAKIEAERSEIADLRTDPKNLVREGSNMVLGWNIRETIKKKEKRIDSYLSLMDKEQGRANVKNQEVKLMSSIDVASYRLIALIVSVTNEAFIIFLLIFIRTYYYKTYKETKIEEGSTAAGKEDSSPTPVVYPAKKDKKPGQIIPGASSNILTSQDSASQLGTLARVREIIDFENEEAVRDYNRLLQYSGVVASNDAGLSIKAIAKEHGISEGTAKNIRRILKKYTNPILA